MVYTGKPSKACARCRERRLRCDLTKPHCRKCQAAQVQCTGYRNEQDLLFRNVTRQVIEKVNNNSPDRASASTATRSSTSDHQSPRLIQAESPEDEVLAVALTFLFRIYLKGSSFDWVEGLYREAVNDSLFYKVVRATALAAYSFECHRTRLLARARSTYDSALLQLRDSISAREIVQDATLASILLMSRFETLVNDGNVTAVTETWTSHIYGAYSIVQSRSDEDNFVRPLSYRLAEQTVHNFNLYCVRKGEHRPPELLRHTQALIDMRDFSRSTAPNVIRLKLHGLSDALTRYRRALRSADTVTISEYRDNGLALEQEVLNYAAELMEYSGFEVRSVDELTASDATFKLEFEPQSCIYHLYQDSHSARLWNGVRMLRLTIHLDLINHSKRVWTSQEANQGEIFEETAQWKESAEIAGEMCSEMCASAPQFLRSGAPDCTHASASYLGWPLYLAGHFYKDGCERFVKDALMWIGSELNIKSAEMAAAGLDAASFDDDCLLACYLF